ncbi:5,10-methylenetetrahydrofolate reductase [Leucobacter sp. OLJS4]|uniref:methylenetetrahydrofolate reductase n=1 Tax=unclassified Leucobacter TaxID=2621730 RepID=UPI000C175EE6|nr:MULTISPECIES: methylenetetrahydrofolate reductase [unclassified Leucobacter]PII81803.1 5,10-methylenetetrahydrofolate reductase [Leucobacter sp. OLCALW19]PII86479.1 5,10-methylenetetrahydrofolate reductase [Leucobacter sp. OLTLW20]PII90374.1 5,10-methylenetetrahydrofolate reductase [Leucobacter sp. OLAS13]PII97408.1 5,10-methylenetetrahydrofolate reductase [Leucobacter sp. OLDS2]PII98840.1 5,10-methylenetetrahydrofolate reductase [Leucobacter sp. OLCS4]
MNATLLTGSAPTRARFSFEVFPARSGAAALALGHAVQHLSAAGPDFISVTYGANGSNRDASLDLLRYLRDHTDALPLAHLTTVGETREAVRATIHGIMDAGVHDFLALRGDPPRGSTEDDPLVSGSLSALELTELIAEARAERPALTSVGRTAVAAYPNGHPMSRSRSEDLDWLVAKQEAGAQFAITQLFFEAEEYLSFVSDARDAGLRIPVLPGLMPVSTSAQLRKVASLAGRPAPAALERALEEAGGYAPELGVEHTISLAGELLAGGAPSVHLYTFNRHEQVLAVLRELNLLAPVG